MEQKQVMFFPPSVLPLRIWLVPSLPSAPLDLCLSVSLCVLSPRRQTGHVLYCHCNKSIQRLQNIHFYLSHPFLAVSIICVWHPFCSIESSWHPSHKQYRCISKSLETSRSLFSSNVAERQKTCAVYWDYFRSSVLFLMTCGVSESEKRSRFSSNLSPEFTEINLWCHK